MSTFANNSKSSSTFATFLRHGKEPTVADLANYTFESVIFQDGTVLKNVTFEQLADAVWSTQTKN